MALVSVSVVVGESDERERRKAPNILNAVGGATSFADVGVWKTGSGTGLLEGVNCLMISIGLGESTAGELLAISRS